MNFLNNKNINKYLFFYISVSLIIHCISVYFSIGFYSDDEHFQLLEPTAYLLGINDLVVNDPTDHYWEWNSERRLRPWLQPYLYFYFIQTLKYFGIFNPFIWVFLIRLIC